MNRLSDGFRAHVCNHAYGVIAILIALGGTAYAATNFVSANGPRRFRVMRGGRGDVIRLARSTILSLACVTATSVALATASVASAASLPGLLQQLSAAAGCIVNGPSTDVATCDNTGRALVIPSSVAVSADGRSAYVTSSSSDAVAVFDRDATTGALTQKAGSAGCLVDGPSTDVATCDNTGRALTNPRLVAVSADGKNAYVASKDDNAVAVFDRNTTTGALTQKAGVAGCTVDAPSTDVATCNNSGRALDTPTAVAVSADGESVYVTSDGSNAVAVFDRDTSTGVLTQKAGAAGCLVDGANPVATCDNTGRALNSPTAVAVSTDGKSAYVTSNSNNAVAVFDRDTSTGVLTQKAGAAGCVVNGPSADVATCDNTGRALQAPSSVAVSADGKSAYLISGQHAVAVFDRDATTGALTQKAGSAGCIVNGPSAPVATCLNSGRALVSPSSVAVSADGQSAYVASNGSAVAVFDRDPFSGALSQKLGAAGCIVDGPSADVATCDNTGRALFEPTGLAVSVDGKSVYVVSSQSDSVAVFRRDLVPFCDPASRIVAHNQTTAIDLVCTDPNGDAITLSVLGVPGNGSLGAVSQAASQVPYTPTPGFAGADSFTYQATANGAQSDAPPVSLTVLGGSPPVCASAARSAGQSAATTLGLSCAAGGDPFTYSIVTGPGHGALGSITQSSGFVDYTPTGGFSGDDSFTYGATSAFGPSSPATFALEVLPTQQGPAGSVGPVGPAGPQGPPAFKLVVALFEAKLKAVAGKRVTIRYISTLQADVDLDVLRGSKLIAHVHGKAREGANAIRWNGRNGKKAAAAGLYKLRLKAVNGNQTTTKTASLKVTKH